MSTLDVEAGGAGEGSSPSEEEVAGLRTALQASRARVRELEPRSRILENKVSELTGKVDALSQQPTAKEYTRAELQGFVDDGRMSQEDADRLLETQTASRVEKTVSAVIFSAWVRSLWRVSIVSETLFSTRFAVWVSRRRSASSWDILPSSTNPCSSARVYSLAAGC